MNFKLDSLNVHILADSLPSVDSHTLVVSCSPQEAFQILMMHCFTGRITSIVPNYEVANELPEMPEKED